MSPVYGLIIVGILLLGGVTAVLGGCSFGGGYLPGNNINVDVYGPPEMFDDPTTEDDMWETDDDGDVEFEASGNMGQLIYGPPEMLEDTADGSETQSMPDSSADESGNPKDSDGSTDDVDMEEGDDFEPSGNLVQLIYGPPEMMGD